MVKKKSTDGFTEALFYFAQVVKNKLTEHQTVLESPYHAMEITSLNGLVEVVSFGKYKLLINKGHSGALAAYVYDGNVMFSYKSLQVWAQLSKNGRKFMSVFDKRPEPDRLPKRYIADIAIFYLFFLELRDKTADSGNYSDFYTFVWAFISNVLNHSLEPLNKDLPSELKDEFIRHYPKLLDACPRPSDKEGTMEQNKPLADQQAEITLKDILSYKLINPMTPGFDCYDGGTISYMPVNDKTIGPCSSIDFYSFTAGVERYPMPFDIPMSQGRNVSITILGFGKNASYKVMVPDSRSAFNLENSCAVYLSSLAYRSGFAINYYRLYLENQGAEVRPVAYTEVVANAASFEYRIARIRSSVSISKIESLYIEFITNTEQFNKSVKQADSISHILKGTNGFGYGTMAGNPVFIENQCNTPISSQVVTLLNRPKTEKFKYASSWLDDKMIRYLNISESVDGKRFFYFTDKDGSLDLDNTCVYYLNTLRATPGYIEIDYDRIIKEQGLRFYQCPVNQVICQFEYACSLMGPDLSKERKEDLFSVFVRQLQPLKKEDIEEWAKNTKETVAKMVGPKEAPCGEIPITAFNDQEKERKMTPNNILNELEATGMTTARVCAPDFKYENGRCFARVASFKRGGLFLAKNDELSAARSRRIYPIKMPLFDVRTVRVLFQGDENDPEINVIFNSADSQSDDEVLTSLFYLNAISNKRGYLIPYWNIARRFIHEEPVRDTELSLTTIRYAVEFEKSIAKKLICPNEICGLFFDFVKKKCEDVGAEQRHSEAALAEQDGTDVEEGMFDSLTEFFNRAFKTKFIKALEANLSSNHADQQEAAVEKTGTTSLCGTFIAQEPDSNGYSSLILLPYEEIIDKSKTIPFVIDNRGPIRVIEKHLDTLRYLDGQLDHYNRDILFLNSINCDWFPVVELLEVVKKACIRPEMVLWARAAGPVGVLRGFYQTFVKIKDSIDVLNKDVVAFYLNEFVSRFKPGTGMRSLAVLFQIRDEIKYMSEKANAEFSACVNEIAKEFIVIPFGCPNAGTPSGNTETNHEDDETDVEKATIASLNEVFNRAFKAEFIKALEARVSSGSTDQPHTVEPKVNCEAHGSSEDDKLADLIANTQERLAKDSKEKYRAVRNAVDYFMKASHDFRQSACEHKQPVGQNVHSLGNYLLSEVVDKDNEHGYTLRKPRLTSSDKPILRPGEQLVKVSINTTNGQLIIDRLY